MEISQETTVTVGFVLAALILLLQILRWWSDSGSNSRAAFWQALKAEAEERIKLERELKAMMNGFAEKMVEGRHAFRNEMHVRFNELDTAIRADLRSMSDRLDRALTAKGDHP